MMIGLDARLTHYRVGGISTYIRCLIHALAGVDSDGRYLILQSRRARQTLTQHFRHAALYTPPHHRLERWALSLELARFRLDVLHSPDFIPPASGAKHHVITVHDLTFLHYPQHKDKAALRYYNGQIRQAVKQADHILVVSEATRQDMIALLDVPAEKMSVQPHGVDERLRPLDRLTTAAERQRLNLPEQYLLFVGTLEPRKNIPTLLEAYRQLASRQQTVTPLVIAGRMGWMFEETAARINDMQRDGLPIILRSDIGDSDLAILYNAAAMLILPSHYEGFGLPVLEAMACGTPVIASRSSSLPEVLGDAGLLVDSQDADAFAAAMERVLTDPELHAKMRADGLARARQFTWERSARIALSVYQQFCTP